TPRRVQGTRCRERRRANRRATGDRPRHRLPYPRYVDRLLDAVHGNGLGPAVGHGAGERVRARTERPGPPGDPRELALRGRVMPGSPDPLAAKRAAMREEFFAKLFLLGGWLGTDTYKRTMWAAVPEISLARAAYSLTFRKPRPEPGAGNQLIMAGHEAMLAQWFHRPLRRQDIELSRQWSLRHSQD